MINAMWHVLLELAPWLLVGATIAGLLHVLLPPSFVRRHFRGRWGVLRAVALGVPLPLCSCGVIPAALGMKKDGASDGATVGFLISTPQTGVDSILVSASFLGWPFALFKVASATLTGVVGGLVTDAVSGGSAAGGEGPVATADVGAQRTLGAFVSHALELLESIWRWLAVGVVVSAAITVYLPAGALTALSGGSTVVAMLVTLAIALPMYVCATASVPIAAALVAGGFPPGAALVFLMAGPATNVATIGAVYRALGARALATYLGTLVVGSLALGLAFDFVLDATAIAVVHHHHEASVWAVGSALLLLALMAWFAAREVATFLRRQRTATARADSIELGVGGMTCDQCVARLERVLLRDDEVEAVKVELATGRAVVSGTISEDHLRELVTRAGFTPGARS